MQGCVVLPTYSRPEFLQKCLDSLYSADISETVDKVIVVQLGDKVVEQLADAYADERTVLIKAPAFKGSPMEKAMRQFWLGVTVALEDPRTKWVMSLEEETVLAKDALRFLSEMFSRYSAVSAFRGVNLGSLETSEDLSGTYSLLRYGFHGAGGALSRKSWAVARAIAGTRKRRLDAFDCQVEKYLKTGFMVTPNLSKYMNYGWIGGSNIPDNEEVRQRFTRLQRSFQESTKRIDHVYRHLNAEHTWRQDCIPFRKQDSPSYWARLIAANAPAPLRELGRGLMG